jgi:hypothetical protein
MTLGNAAAPRVRLIVWCKACRYQVEPDPAEMAERYGAEVAATHFVRTGQLLDDREMHSVGGVRAELLLSAALALIVAGFSTYLALG